MNYLKYIIYIPGILLLSFSLGSCFKEVRGYNEPVSGDATKPQPVSNVRVENLNGGAYITYTLPNSPNILYVLAQYDDGVGRNFEVKSSYYSDTIKVEGFPQSKEYNVKLFTVSRSEVKSDPVEVKIFPKTPVYQTVFPTVSISPDFGGVLVSAVDSLKEAVGVILITKDQYGRWMPIERHYTTTDTILFNVRGYDVAPREFGVYITNKWGHNSDTLFQTITPYPEFLLDKSSFRALFYPGDSPSAYGWVLTRVFDNDINTGYHSDEVGTMPKSFTIDLGAISRLSRYKIWQRSGNGFDFAHGNPKRWVLWGSVAAPPADGSYNGWFRIGEFNSPEKPSGSPMGTVTSADIAFNKAGFDYNMPVGTPAVRYIRFQTLETWGNGNFAHVMELTFWGTPQQ